MNHRIYKIISMVSIGVLMSFSFASAKNFTIYNATNINQPYFSVNGTSGNIGIGMTNPSSPLQMLNNSWISARNAAGTGAVNMFKINANDQIEVGAPLNIGSFEFSPDSGLVTFVDMPVSATPTIGTPEGYAFKVDGDNIMTIYSESNGFGGLQNKRIGIGLTNPTGLLHVAGTENIIFNTTGNVGIGTTSPRNKLDFASSTINQINVAGGYIAGLDLTPTNSDQAVPLGYLQSNYSSTSSSLWSGTKNGSIWNGSAGAGNVGIGTTNPYTSLSIKSPVTNKNDFLLTLHGADNGGAWYGLGFGLTAHPASFIKAGITYQITNSTYGSGNLNFLIASSTNGTNATATDAKMTITHQGSVGIGTTNPASLLDVNGTNGTSRITLNSSTYLQGGWGGNPNIMYIGSNVATSYLYLTAGAIQMGASTAGSALLKRGSTDNTTEIIGGIATDAQDFRIYNTYTNATNYERINMGWQTNPNVFTFETAKGSGGGLVRNIAFMGGNIGIGTTSPRNKLDFASSTINQINVAGGYIAGLDLTPTNSDQAVPLGYLQSNYAPIGSGAGSAFVQGGNSFGGIATLGTNDNNLLNIETNSTTRMTIAANGNVGIGTTNPGVNLEIDSDANTFGYGDGIRIYGHQNSASYRSVIGFYRSRGTKAIPAATQVNDVIGSFSFFGRDDSSYKTTATIRSVQSGAFGTVGNGNLEFWTADGTTESSKMTILGNGNVGIGTTAPGYKLSVSGEAQVDSLRGKINDDFLITSHGNAPGEGFTFKTNAGGITAMKISYEGNVGIGTTNPLHPLHIYKTGVNNQLFLNNPTGSVGDTSGILFGTSPSETYAKAGIFFERLDGAAQGSLHFSTGNSGGAQVVNKSNARMTITMDGNVGIGTTSPVAKLAVYSTDNNAIYIGGRYMAGLDLTPINPDHAVPLAYLQNNYSSTSSSLWTGTKNGNIRNGDAGAGNVGIGVTSPIVKLDVAGGVAFRSSGEAGQASRGIEFTPTTWDAGVQTVRSWSAGGGLLLDSANTGTANAGSEIQLYASNSGSGDIVFRGTDYGTVQQDRMIIKGSSGNVGIGTTAPAAKLDVNAATGNEFTVYDGFYQYNIGGDVNSKGGPNTNYLSIWKDGSKTYFNTVGGDAGYRFRVSGNDMVSINSVGNVGIGTTNPASKLAIYSGDDKDVGPIINLGGNSFNQTESGRIRFTETNMGASPYYQGAFVHYDGLGNALNIGVHDINNALQSGDTNVISIARATGNTNIGNGSLYAQYSGNVGIGTTAPGYLLDVAGVSSSNALRVKGLYTDFQSSGGENRVRIQHGNDGNSSMITLYDHAAATQIVLNTGGGSYFNTGNLGIGSTTPNHKLSVTAVDGNGIGVAGASGNAVNIGGGQIANLNLTQLNPDHAVSLYYATTTFFMHAGNSFGATATLGTNDNNNLNIETNNSVRMTVANNGNIGISTTNPQAKLEIASTTNIEGLRIISSNYSPFVIRNSANTADIFRIDQYGNITGGIGNSTAWTRSTTTNQLYVTDLNDKVGIGTTLPQQKMHIVSSAVNTNQPSSITNSVNDTHTGLFINNGLNLINSKYGIQFGGYNQYSFGGLFGVMTSSAGATIGDLTFDLKNAAADATLTERMRITSSGRVGIGTSNPGALLQVGENIATSGPIIMLGSQSGNYDSLGTISSNEFAIQPFSYFHILKGYAYTTGGRKFNTGDYMMTINNQDINFSPTGNTYFSTGNVGIGTTTPASKLQLNGNMRLVGTLNFRSSFNYDVLNISGDNSYVGHITHNTPLGASYGANGMIQLDSLPNSLGADGSTHQKFVRVIPGITQIAAAGFTAFEVDTSETSVGTGAKFLMNIKRSGNSKLVVDGAGNVGIGITNPRTKLDFASSTIDQIHAAGGYIGGLDLTPVNSDQAVPLGYLQSNYSATSSSLWSGAKNGNIWNGDSGTGNVGIGITNPVSKLHVNGGVSMKRTPVADANYTVQADDYIIGYTSISTNRTVTLPNALCTAGRFFVVLDESGNASASAKIIIDPEGTTPIIGLQTLPLEDSYNSVYVFCGNNAWYIL